MIRYTPFSRKKLDYALLRWEMTTSQLVQLAELMRVDISDIPKNGKRKLMLANRMGEALGVK